MKNLLILFIFFYSVVATAQSVAINNDGTTAVASAVLDLKSTTKGFLPPRMTIAERDDIVSPATGLLIWCTDCGTTGAINIYNGTMWTSIAAGITAGTTAGDLQYWNGTAWVVVGEGNAGQVLTWNDSGIPTWTVVNATASAAPTIGTATQAIGTAAVGNGKASVSFTAPTNNGFATITSYTATSSPEGLTGTISQSGSGSIIITGLTSGTPYKFSVTATNAIGTSTASVASNAVVVATAPYVPTNISAVHGNREAVVSFIAPINNGGSAITSYTATSSPGSFTGTLTQAGSGSITVTGLTNGTPYSFNVIATNAKGPSVSAASNAITPVTVPDTPGIGIAVVTGSGQASVTYTAPAYDGSLPITKYTATSSPGDFTGILEQSGSGAITVPGLSLGTVYTFTVTATNAAGDSSLSEATISVTPLASVVADAPIIVTAIGGKGLARVTYTAPGYDGGASITKYTATSVPGDFTGILEQSGSGTITVLGLLSGIAYSFTVTATNEAGISAPSAATNEVTLDPVAIGDLREGGIVFWVDPTDNTKGMVCALEDANSQLLWDDAKTYCNNYSNPDTGTGVYNDWYLPSLDQLGYMFHNLADSDNNNHNTGVNDPSNLGGFVADVYWSNYSNQLKRAHGLYFSQYYVLDYGTSTTKQHVRAARSF